MSLSHVLLWALLFVRKVFQGLVLWTGGNTKPIAGAQALISLASNADTKYWTKEKQTNGDR